MFQRIGLLEDVATQLRQHYASSALTIPFGWGPPKGVPPQPALFVDRTKKILWVYDGQMWRPLRLT